MKFLTEQMYTMCIEDLHLTFKDFRVEGNNNKTMHSENTMSVGSRA